MLFVELCNSYYTLVHVSYTGVEHRTHVLYTTVQHMCLTHVSVMCIQNMCPLKTFYVSCEKILRTYVSHTCVQQICLQIIFTATFSDNKEIIDISDW